MTDFPEQPRQRRQSFEQRVAASLQGLRPRKSGSARPMPREEPSAR